MNIENTCRCAGHCENDGSLDGVELVHYLCRVCTEKWIYSRVELPPVSLMNATKKVACDYCSKFCPNCGTIGRLLIKVE